MGVLLQNYAGDHLAVEGVEALETALDVEDEDESVFEGTYAAAGYPTATYGCSKEVG